MKKFTILLLIFFIFIFISSVNANDLNCSDINSQSIPADDVIQVTNNPEDTLSEINQDFIDKTEKGIDENNLECNLNNEILKSSNDGLIINPDFDEDLEGWDIDGTVSVVTGSGADNQEGKYVSLSAVRNSASSSLTQHNIDWTYITSLGYWVKGGTLTCTFTISIGDYTDSFAVKKNTGWTYHEVDTTDFKGVTDLVFTMPDKSTTTIFLDSINYTAIKATDFTVNAYVDTPVYFNYSDSEDITKWYWDFADGGKSIDPNPLHIYNQTGFYETTLTIFNDTDSKVISYGVNVIEKIVPDFSFSQGSSNSARFYDSSSGDPMSWFWDFGDGKNQTSTSTFASHIYPKESASYIVTLTVTDRFGANYSVSKSIDMKIYSTVPYVVGQNSFENSTEGWTLSDGASISNNNSYDGEYSVWLGTSGIEKIINFDNIDSIDFYGFSQIDSGGVRYVYLYIDGEEVYRGQLPARSWTYLSYSTSNLIGNHTVKLVNPSGHGYLDYITLKTNSNYLANFTTEVTDINGEEITVKFTDNSYGTISQWLWNFDDGNSSTSQNPTYTFKKGDHDVSLVIYRDNIKMSSITKVLSLNLPSINENSYSSIQDAINSAGDGDVVEIPQLIGGAYSENLFINKSLILNFNGAIINAKDNSLPLINVTDGAIVTITNIGLNKAGTFATDAESKLIIKDSNIGVNLALNEGNIELLDDSFNNAYLTIAANTNIANSTVTNGGIIVNGGKSRIFNTTLTDCNVAVTQNDGELDIISNLITGNNICINVTGGKTNIEYNIIYSNTFGLVYAGDNVTNANNWWGGVPSIGQGSELTDPVDIFKYGEDSPSFDSILILDVTSNDKVMGSGKEYVINVALTNNGVMEGYFKTFDLDFTSASGIVGSVVVENGVGQTTLLTTVSEADSIVLTTLGEDYPLDDCIIASATNVLINLEGDAAVGSNMIVNVEVPNANGNVTFIIDSEKYSRELIDGKANYTINNLASGLHTIMAVYEGNDIFAKTYNVTSFTVPGPENQTINVVINGKEYSGNLNNGTVSVDTNGTVSDGNMTIIVDGKEIPVSVVNGTVSVPISDIVGKNMTVVINGKEYSGEFNNGSIVINDKVNELINTTVSVDKLNIKAGDNGILKVTLKDINGKALSNTTVNVVINGVTYNGVTGADGIAQISVKYASAGTYYATVYYSGDDTYKSSTANAKIIVSKKATALTAPKKTFKAKVKTKKVTITLKSGKTALKGKKVTLKVKGKTYKATTNAKGKATFKVKNLKKKGTFKYTVKFAGDNAYKAISKKGTIKIKK